MPTPTPMKPDDGAHTLTDKNAQQVRWYRAYGRYPDLRIQRTYRGRGDEYVVGDWSWRRNHPNKPEAIDHLLP